MRIHQNMRGSGYVQPITYPLGTIKASHVVVPNEDSVVVTQRKLM